MSKSSKSQKKSNTKNKQKSLKDNNKIDKTDHQSDSIMLEDLSATEVDLAQTKIKNSKTKTSTKSTRNNNATQSEQPPLSSNLINQENNPEINISNNQNKGENKDTQKNKKEIDEKDIKSNKTSNKIIHSINPEKSKNNITPESHFIGHRSRLREKFYKHADNISDYEILEIILFWSIPRKDTKLLAKTLLKIFGSLSNVLYAQEDKILAIPGITKNILLNFLVIKEFMKRTLQNKFMNQHALSSWNALIEYLQATMGDLKVENFRAIFLNTKNIIIADELQSTGTIDQTPIYVREIVKRALFHEAAALILVHNHPSGNPKPSKADLHITKEIKTACLTFNITLHDHVIVCKNKFFSFKSSYML